MSTPASVTGSRRSSSSGRTQGPQQRIGNYEIHETIGQGSFGKVKRGIHIPSGEKVAIKILNRKKLKDANMDKKIRREIHILKLFRHPNICRLYEVLQTNDDILLIMEYVEGGELYAYIVQQGKLNEQDARFVFQQVVCALEYCHHFRVVHRDLKPENILLTKSLQVKLIDFGLANLMRDGDFLATSCGSPNYASPEVISGKLYCGPEVDVWSCGVVLYALLVGCLPFDEETIPQLFKKIKEGSYTIPDDVPPGARDLLKRLLRVDPLVRSTIPQIRDHSWFNYRLPSYLLFSEAVSQEQSRISSQAVRTVCGMLGVSNAQVRNEINQSKGAAFVAYCIVTDGQKRTKIASLGPPGSTTPSPGASASASTSSAPPTGSPTPLTATLRELNHGLLLSTTPAIDFMLDLGNAAANKSFYNNAVFTPSSAKGTGVGSGGGTSSVGAHQTGNDTGVSNQSFSLTRHQQRGGMMGNASFSGSEAAAAVTTGSLRQAASLHQQQRTGSSRGSASTNAGPSGQHRVGSVAKTSAMYTEEERNATFDASAGWRVGIMSDKSSNAAMGAIYHVLKALKMNWKMLGPNRLGVRSASQNGVTDPNEVVLVVCLFRLQEAHDKGYIVDCSVKYGHPITAMDICNRLLEMLIDRLN